MLIYVAIVFLPLIAAAIAGLLGRLIGDRGAQVVTCSAVALSAILSGWVFFQFANGADKVIVPLSRWMIAGTFDVNWSLRIDALTAVMLVVVNSVSCMVHIYSIGYMSHDKSIPRFMSYLSLFTFFMLMLVTANNLVQLFFGWEGVGLASYLLIGFWYERPSANAAAMKAFLVNRVGDLGFALGIFLLFKLFGTVSLDAIFAQAPEQAGRHVMVWGAEFAAMELAAILLFIGACGKSAQLGLHTWLPDAMEGPTPVSALIHAATMVTAGVFLVARMSPIFELAPTALIVVTVVGGATALFAATIGVTQNDIKRVIAYSTCSQLGYMFFACGVSAYAAGMFHLLTHGFFKALLFLGAGSVIHALSDEQDMRRMGGIARHIPISYILMLIGSLSLAGIGIPGTGIGFAGFYSKDLILEAAYASHTAHGMFAFWAGTIAAFLTAFYSWRLLLMTFHGAPRANEKVMAHVHESPWIMLGPLCFLAFGAIFAGIIFQSLLVGEHYLENFWNGALFVGEGNDSIEAAHHVPSWVKILPVFVGVAGIAMAHLVYRSPTLPARLARMFRPIYQLSYNKWYFDELYTVLFVRPTRGLAHVLWQRGDIGTIDTYGPNGIARVASGAGQLARQLQTGSLHHYAFAMLIGVVVITLAYAIRKAGWL